MLHIQFEVCNEYPVAVLCKEEALQASAIEQYYMDSRIPRRDYIAFGLSYGGKKKPTASFMKEYLYDLMKELKALKVKYLYCTDGNYFKVLTGNTKADIHLGYSMPCTLSGYEEMTVILSANHKAIFANDAVIDKIKRANDVLADLYTGSYVPPGTNIIKHAQYVPCDPQAIRKALEPYLLFPALVCDTEAFALRHTEAGLGTIAFAPDITGGIAIDVMHNRKSMGFDTPESVLTEIKEVLRWFFETYEGTVIYHNATFDIKLLIYFLYMNKVTDTEGLIQGLGVMTRNFECTKIISYLALNTCSEVSYRLKDLAHEFAGNYAQSSIDDITQITSKVLLEYNLVDCLSTWFVYNKYYPLMVKDEQETVYKTLFKRMVKQIVQMELTGMPLNMVRVKEVDQELSAIIQQGYTVLKQSKLMAAFRQHMREQEVITRNAEYKKKVITIDEAKWEFNPNSNDDLAKLLHDFCGFEVFATTPTGLPCVGGDELEGHLARTNDSQVKEVIQTILDILDATKIKNTFVAKFLDAVECDGWHYLFGNFNIGGTISSRLSSSNPVSLFD